MLVEAGVIRMMVPKRFGGLELGFSDLLKVNLTLAQACGSTAWCALQGAFHNFAVAQYPLEAQQEVWAEPGAVVSSALMPTGKYEAVDGGYRLWGEWAYASNCDNATWMIVGIMLAPDKEGAPPALAWCLAPRSVFHIKDTWFSVGMAGTGSKTVVATEPFFVPHARVLKVEVLNSGAAPGSLVHANPLYRLRFSHMGPACLVSIPVGVALGAVEDFKTMARSKTPFRMGAPPVPMASLPHVQLAVADIAAAAETAALLLTHDFDQVEAGLATATMPSVDQRIVNRRNQAYAGRLASQAVNRIMEVAGSSATAASSPLQRAWRDVNMAVTHISLGWSQIGSMYGQHQLGLPPVGSY